MAITPARAQEVDFSIPVYNAPREAVVVLASDPTAYHNLADLKAVPGGVQKGSIQYALLQKTGGFSDLKVYDTVKDVWSAVASGQVKAGVTAGGDTIYAAKQGALSGLRIVNSYQSPSPIPRVGIAVRADAFLVRGGDPNAVEGGGFASRVIIIEFDSPEQANAWYHCPEYQAIVPIRQANSTTRAACLVGA